MVPRWMMVSGSLAVIAILVSGIQLLPPLTEGGLPRSVPPYGAESAPDDPEAWCRANLPGVNCACFAQKAGEVMSEPHEPIPGMAYANRWELARTQAGDGC